MIICVLNNGKAILSYTEIDGEVYDAFGTYKDQGHWVDDRISKNQAEKWEYGNLSEYNC